MPDIRVADMASKPFTVATLAERWGCSTDAVYALIRAKKLPAFRVGGKLIRVLPSEVEKWESAGASIPSDDIDSEPSTGKQPSAGKTKRGPTAEDLASLTLK